MNNSLSMLFFKWFFWRQPQRLLYAAHSFLLWGWHFFSIGFLSRHLFSAWHRDISGYGRGFDLKRFLEVWGWNMISRVLGAIMRVAVVAFGFLVEAGFLIISVIIVVGWFLLPVLIPVLIVLSALTLTSPFFPSS